MYYGVPQYSVLTYTEKIVMALGSLLFSLYILPLKNMISNFPSVKYQICADDIYYILNLQ